MSTEEYNLFSATEITFTGSVASADTIVFSNAGTVTAISSVENYTLAAAGNTITGLAACSETFTPTGGTNVVNLGTHTAADSVNVTTNAFETITGFGSSTGTVNDELLVTGTGDALAHTFPINETMHAQDTAALTAASGYVFVDSQAGVTLTAASVAALFSSTQSAGKWAIQHPSFGTQRFPALCPNREGGSRGFHDGTQASARSRGFPAY